jgi:hypothetical protein
VDAVITVGEQITVVIPPDTAVYADLEAGYRYRYGLTVVHPSLDLRMQGTWQILLKYGPADAAPNDWTVSVDDSSIVINLGGVGPQGNTGDQGLVGPAGPWEAVSRLVTSSGVILPTDTLVFATAAGGDIELSVPDPADIWDGVNGRVITIARTAADTGKVTITGSADGLPLELFSSSYAGESVYITTTDGVELIVSDAPFVVQVTEQGAGSYLELEFTAADLVDAGLPLPVLIGSVPDGSLVRTVVVRFTSYFDAQVQLSVGQAGQEKTVFFGTEPPDEEGYETDFFIKFSGAITLTPDFTTAPTVGIGTIFLTY